MRHALIASVNGENMLEYFISEALKEESTFIHWCAHPEFLFANGNIRKTKDGFIVEGQVSYRDSEEKVTLFLNQFGETISKSCVSHYDGECSLERISADHEEW